MKIGHPEDDSFFKKIKFRLLKLFSKDDSLDSLLKGTFLFQTLTEDQFLQLKRSVKILSCQSGDRILQEGEPGNTFFIIKKGAVRVYTSNPADNTEITVARLEEGEYFGEQALLEGLPGKRISSVKAVKDSQFYTIPHEVYLDIMNPELKKILKEIGEKQISELFYHKQEALFSLDKDVVRKLSGKVQKFSSGEVIFKVNDPSDTIYFIISGKVQIEIPGKEGITRTELGSGSLFGELGVMEKTKRAGTATAVGDLQVLCYDRAAFAKLHETSPQLRLYINSLKNVYQIKHQGKIELYHGKFLNLNAVIAIYTLENGTIVKAARTIGSLAFSMNQDNIQGTKAINYAKGADIRRKLEIKDHKVYGVFNFGEWGELGEVCNLILKSKPITDEQIESFIKTGNLGLKKLLIISEEEKNEILCSCMNVSKRQIYDLIGQGVNNFKDLSRATGAGSVCGTCRPKIVELIGLKAWHTAKLIEKIPLTTSIGAFRFQIEQGIQLDYKPGMHVVISGLIDNLFINRNYTITSVCKHHSYIELIVKREPKGYFSNWLFDKAQESSVFRISDPAGNFTLSERDEGPVICLTGGVGVTPAVAFARYLSLNGRRKLHIDYSEQTEDDFILKDEWNEITTSHNNITVRFRPTRTAGRIQSEEIAKLTREFPNAEYYICGPESFENSIVSFLIQHQVPKEKIMTEKFVHAGSSKNKMIES